MYFYFVLKAPILFAKAAEIFISELSLRAWIHTEDNKRRTLQVGVFNNKTLWVKNGNFLDFILFFFQCFFFLIFLLFNIQRNDIAMAITKYDQFDFLIDIVPRDELKPTKRQVCHLLSIINIYYHSKNFCLSLYPNI